MVRRNGGHSGYEEDMHFRRRFDFFFGLKIVEIVGCGWWLRLKHFGPVSRPGKDKGWREKEKDGGEDGEKKEKRNGGREIARRSRPNKYRSLLQSWMAQEVGGGTADWADRTDDLLKHRLPHRHSWLGFSEGSHLGGLNRDRWWWWWTYDCFFQFNEKTVRKLRFAQDGIGDW